MNLRKLTSLTLLSLLLLIALSGCNGARDKARLQLAQLNVPFLDTTFIDNARQGNTDVVKLFLEGGMDIETKSSTGQRLKEALAIDVVALVTSNDGTRNALLNQAITKKNQAKNLMVN